jgi:1-acyl-sn-glycerol-3-phosphate acyltransferase
MEKIIPKSFDLTPFHQRIFLWLLVWLHVIRGICIILIIFPFCKTVAKHAHIKEWSKQLLSLFGIELKINNPEVIPLTPFLLASNHISWVDIHALNAYHPIRFVAKSEVKDWPIFGWMAKQLGTVFIQRGNSRNTVQVISDMATVLRTESICIFPEGTSTEGFAVRTFRANLFESAIISNVPVYSLAIEYLDRVSGFKTDTTAFVGEMGLLESMSKMLKHRNLRAELTFFPPLAADPQFSIDRKWLAIYSQEQISAYLARSL